MAWDTEGTKRRLLDAAVTEFAEHGPAGARVDRIAAAAGINKERIYQYFGSKAGLFQATLDREMLALAAAVPITREAVADIGVYAGNLFDYHAEHPHFLRLLQWEGLSGTSASPPSADRRDHYRDKLASIARAQSDGLLPDTIPAGDVLYAVVALAAWWHIAPRLGEMILLDAGADRSARRAITVELARRMITSPGTNAHAR